MKEESINYLVGLKEAGMFDKFNKSYDILLGQADNLSVESGKDYDDVVDTICANRMKVNKIVDEAIQKKKDVVVDTVVEPVETF